MCCYRIELTASPTRQRRLVKQFKEGILKDGVTPLPTGKSGTIHFIILSILVMNLFLIFYLEFISTPPQCFPNVEAGVPLCCLAIVAP